MGCVRLMILILFLMLLNYLSFAQSTVIFQYLSLLWFKNLIVLSIFQVFPVW